LEIKKEQQKIAVLLGSGSLPLYFEIFLIYEKILVKYMEKTDPAASH
jgi:hypothetical protein